jgi:hypothetical protein
MNLCSIHKHETTKPSKCQAFSPGRFPVYRTEAAHSLLQNDKQITKYTEYGAVNTFDQYMHAANASCSCERTHFFTELLMYKYSDKC